MNRSLRPKHPVLSSPVRAQEGPRRRPLADLDAGPQRSHLRTHVSSPPRAPPCAHRALHHLSSPPELPSVRRGSRQGRGVPGVDRTPGLCPPRTHAVGPISNWRAGIQKRVSTRVQVPPVEKAVWHGMSTPDSTPAMILLREEEQAGTGAEQWDNRSGRMEGGQPARASYALVPESPPRVFGRSIDSAPHVESDARAAADTRRQDHG